VKEMNSMTVRVVGEQVPDRIVDLYVKELVKAHPDKRIRSVDIIVEGDSLKVRMLHDLERSA
jgi:hypothetical protein